jgi:hypothetical protein
MQLPRQVTGPLCRHPAPGLAGFAEGGGAGRAQDEKVGSAAGWEGTALHREAEAAGEHSPPPRESREGVFCLHK